MGNYGERGNQRHHEVVAGAGQKVHLQKAPAATGYFSPPWQLFSSFRVKMLF